ncbi:glycosyltransferase family 2 protein [Alkalicoccus halolimnae]|uniref:Glycosyltransferase family A protein n=1 Tax=Alkalicoccus halolimnae TaxID=1667239 RepID=A0A5C7F680_9BACI|nr:glycosyltransferase family A protein [Alkalicoccus halolimnae]TXF85523.1 glycosyltransferase family 2 protein [Alkalicoccus halolimnae]
MNRLQMMKKNISARMTKEQRDRLKQVLPFIGLPTAKVETAKWKLNNLGFTERGLQDLEDLYEHAKQPVMKRYAAFELALWHVNQYTEEGAEKALDYLSALLTTEEDQETIRRASILAAEAMGRLDVIDRAEAMLDTLIKRKPHPDLYLARANTLKNAESRISYLNKVFSNAGLLNVQLDPAVHKQLSAYDALEARVKKEIVNQPALRDVKVTVLVPVYHAEKTLQTAVRSLQAQTWTNLEIFIIDDASKDGTVEAADALAKKDARIKVLQVEENGGPYAARNLALKQAEGTFVTVNDADDWSHPEKIEKQVLHLLAHDDVVANMSQQARMFEDLSLHRRARPGEFLFNNMSSFMFRREKVLDKLGSWDRVRFAADSEFIFRVRRLFGEQSVVELATGPLSFQRQSGESLTGNEAFGLPNYKMGVRREYEMAHDYHHKHAGSLFYDPYQKVRPFPVPEPMLLEREGKEGGFRKFDVVFAADFRAADALPLEEMQAAQQDDKRIGLVLLYRYNSSPFPHVHPRWRKLINNGAAEMLVYGEKIRTEEIRFPDIEALQEKQRYVPLIEAGKAVVTGKVRNKDRVEEAVRRLSGKAPEWNE